MKKLFLYIFLGLLWCNVGFAECIKGDCNNGYGTYIYEDGRQYVGEWKYVGQFKNDEPHEHGILTTADGSKWVLENGEVVKKINE